jgi:hypothetical protein
VLWLALFLAPSWRVDVTLLSAMWAAIMVLSCIRGRPTAPAIFWHLLHGRRQEAEALVH